MARSHVVVFGERLHLTDLENPFVLLGWHQQSASKFIRILEICCYYDQDVCWHMMQLVKILSHHPHFKFSQLVGLAKSYFAT